MFSSGCRRGILALGSGGGFNPLVLFASGEQGGWWDPSDLSTLSQTSNGATGNVAVGDPVGFIADKSGRGNHRTQATAGSRPTLQQDASGYYYLNYDGVDDSMATGSVDFTATDKMTIWAGINKQSDAVVTIFAELSADTNANNGSFFLAAPNTAANPRYAFTPKGTLATAAISASNYAAPISNVVCCIADLAANPAAKIRINAVETNNAAGAGTGAFGNYPLYFGRRGGATLPFTGREYQTIIRAAASDSAVIQRAERFVASKMGVVVP